MDRPARDGDGAGRGMTHHCTKCADTGWYYYDHNHATVCDLCCTHHRGVSLLGEYYMDAGRWCCLAGCGTTWADEDSYNRGEPGVR